MSTFGFRKTETHVLAGDESPADVTILSLELRTRVVYGLAKIGVPVKAQDIVVKEAYNPAIGRKMLVATCEYDAPPKEVRERLIEAFDEGQMAGHEHEYIKSEGHPSRFAMLADIAQSPYRPEAVKDGEDEDLARVMDMAWVRGFFTGVQAERNPGTGGQLQHPY